MIERFRFPHPHQAVLGGPMSSSRICVSIAHMCAHTDTYTNKHKQNAFKVEGVVEISEHHVLGEEGCEFCLLRAT